MGSGAPWSRPGYAFPPHLKGPVVDRCRILRELIEWRSPLDDLARKAQELSWDSEFDVTALSASDVARVLQRVVDGTVSTRDAEAWANVLEGREDVALEGGREGVISKVLHEL